MIKWNFLKSIFNVTIRLIIAQGIGIIKCQIMINVM